MRIDDLCFFLKVECILVVLNIGLLVSVTIILFVVREDIFRVWVSNESISTALESTLLLVTGGQILN